MVSRPTRSQLITAVWAMRQWRAIHRRLAVAKLELIQVSAAPRLGLAATRGVRLALRLCHATCLERSLIMQRWYLDQGESLDVVIGVQSPGSKFGAHAWLERPGQLTQFSYAPLVRRTSDGALVRVGHEQLDTPA